MQATHPDGLIPISMAMLSSSIVPGIDIYLKSSADSAAVLFCPAEDLPSFKRIEPLAREGVNKLFIDRSDRGKYQSYLRDNWEELLADESQSATNRMAVMSEVMRDVLNEEFTSGDTAGIVAASQSLARGSCQVIAQHPVVVNQLCSVLHHDYATFTHCTNVSFYCVLLARELGFDAEVQEEIAVGALLHDLGKLKIDERILTKPARLDEFEFREIQRHPSLGFEELTMRPDVTYGQLMMAYQHHERLDGSGYPVGLPGDEIHPYAKICGIVDVYEALTSQRPYRMPMNPSTALAVLDKGDSTEFDSEMLHCWRHLIKAQT